MPAAPPQPSSGSRLPGVEGLRAVAASSILLWHCWTSSSPEHDRASLGPVSEYLFPHLPLGVTLFFAISGFLLYRPFAAAALDGGPAPSLRRYLRNRALRIVPAYWVVLAIVAVAFERVLLEQPRLLLENTLLVQNYRRDSLLSGIGPAWSLAVEAVFYLLLPLLALAALALARPATSAAGRRAAALAPAALLLAVGLSGKLVAAYGVHPGPGANPGWQGDWHSVVERSFWAQADLFAFGMTLAVLTIEVQRRRLVLPRRWRPAAIAAGLAVATVTAAVAPNELTQHGEPLHYAYGTAMSLACTLLLALVVLRGPDERPWALARFLETRPLVLAGLVSYSVFLWHEPLVLALRDHGLTRSGTDGFLVNLAVLAVLTGVLSALTYRLVERPALRRKSGRTAEPAMAPSQAQAAP